MAMTTFQPWRKQGDDEQERKKKSTFSNLLPWPLVLMAAVPVALAVYYLTMVGPTEARVLSAADVPLPAATKFLGDMCDWCGKNRIKVVLMGAGLLMGGLLSSLLAARYYIWLTVLVSLGLGFTYYSVSAPVDRLIKAVKESVPQDRRVPGSR